MISEFILFGIWKTSLLFISNCLYFNLKLFSFCSLLANLFLLVKSYIYHCVVVLRYLCAKLSTASHLLPFPISLSAKTPHTAFGTMISSYHVLTLHAMALAFC